MPRLTGAQLSLNYLLRYRLGDELFGALVRVDELRRMEKLNEPVSRRKLASLRAWMGGDYWIVLVGILKNGSLTVDAGGDKEKIRFARDAVAMVIDWERECVRWQLWEAKERK